MHTVIMNNSVLNQSCETIPTTIHVRTHFSVYPGHPSPSFTSREAISNIFTFLESWGQMIISGQPFFWSSKIKDPFLDKKNNVPKKKGKKRKKCLMGLSATSKDRIKKTISEYATELLEVELWPKPKNSKKRGFVFFDHKRVIFRFFQKRKKSSIPYSFIPFLYIS